MAKVAGPWRGTWRSAKFASTSGTFHVTFQVNGSSFSGTVSVSTQCVSQGTVSGSVVGNKIKFGAVQGNELVTFDGTVNGDTMGGTYHTGKGCGTDNGTWSASRS
ncbi:MAG TPA: hypothetical protein VIK08_11460 [Candidatus Limnocylindrales bacterium]